MEVSATSAVSVRCPVARRTQNTQPPFGPEYCAFPFAKNLRIKVHSLQFGVLSALLWHWSPSGKDTDRGCAMCEAKRVELRGTDRNYVVSSCIVCTSHWVFSG